MPTDMPPDSPESDLLRDPAVARKLALFASRAEQAIVVGSGDGRVEWANEAACRLSGWRDGEIVGRTLQLFPDDPDAERAVSQHIRERLRAGARARVEASVRHRHGRTLWVALEVTPVPGEGGAAGGWVAIVTDMTERKRAEAALAESEERYRSMVEHSPEPMAVHSQGRVVFANRAALQLLGATSADAVLGRSLFDFLHPDYYGMAVERIQKMELVGDPAAPVVETLLRVDGTPVDVELAATPIVWRGEPAIQLAGHALGAPRRPEALPQRRPVIDLSRLVLELAPQLEAAVAPRAAVSFDLAGNLAPIEGERQRLAALVVALVAYATTVLPDGLGGVRLRTAMRELDARALEAFAASGHLRPGRFVTLEVGVDCARLPEILAVPFADVAFPERIPAGGAGLASAIALARAHGGVLRVESGAGTRILVALPLSKPAERGAR
jgi:PAS domain S-box-containing protein